MRTVVIITLSVILGLIAGYVAVHPKTPPTQAAIAEADSSGPCHGPL